MFYFLTASEVQETIVVCKTIANLTSKIRAHVIDNGNNEIWGGGVNWDAGGDEKQLMFEIAVCHSCLPLHIDCTSGTFISY